MTRRDFELIANALKAAKPTAHPEGTEAAEIATLAENVAWRNVALSFADHLSATNPRFDRERFLRACGVE